jgi:predicted transcriptional regulator
MERLTITLDDEQAEKLSRLAERMHVQPGTIARSLLSSALDEATPTRGTSSRSWTRSPGAYERARLGLEHAKAGEGIPLSEL